MIVVDTNVIGYLYLTSGRSGDAEAVLRRDPEWAAPLLWRSELGNVLATYVRERHLEVADALEIIDKATALMAGHEFAVSPQTALVLATESGCSAYDCEFVALALDLGVTLVTADAELCRRFPAVAVSLATFAAGA